jgi:hypothetical protein
MSRIFFLSMCDVNYKRKQTYSVSQQEIIELSLSYRVSRNKNVKHLSSHSVQERIGNNCMVSIISRANKYLTLKEEKGKYVKMYKDKEVKKCQGYFFCQCVT